MISNPRHGSPPRLMAHQPTRCSTTQESSIRVHRPEPVSRPRLFIVALRTDLDRLGRTFADGPSLLWTTDALKRSYALLRPDLRQAWRWWRLPAPPVRNVGLADLILNDPPDVEWHSEAETRYLLSLTAPNNRAKVEAAKREGGRIVGTIYRRTRRDETGAKAQRAEVRFDAYRDACVHRQEDRAVKQSFWSRANVCGRGYYQCGRQHD